MSHENFSQDSDPGRTIHINSGESFVKREWVYDGRIAVITCAMLTRHSVDEWIDLTKETISNWPPNQPFRLMQDGSDPRNMITPYLATRVNELNQLFPNLEGFLAVVVPHTIGGQMIKMFMNKIALHHHVTTKAFVTRSDGLEWLSQAS
jgi:hypothetical protein